VEPLGRGEPSVWPARFVHTRPGGDVPRPGKPAQNAGAVNLPKLLKLPKLPKLRDLQLSSVAAFVVVTAAVAYAAMMVFSPVDHATSASKRLETAGGSRFLIADGDGTEQVKTLLVAGEGNKGLNLQESSLADTQADGAWSIGPNGQAQPSLALRRRFDYFLLLQGERDIAALTADIQRQVSAAHGQIAAQQVMALWASYLQLQQHRWTTQVDMQRPSTWSSALTERSMKRRELLGIAWADAFYREEEADLRQLIAKSNSQDQTASTAAERNLPNTLPDAPQRQAEVDAEWQQWSQRLEAARSQIAKLQQAPELSEPQRADAVAAYVASQFSGSELLRVKALLKL
jgi:lipase chaperone LimK